MVKLALLLVLVCFQFSKSEELSALRQVRDLEDPLYDEYDGSDEEQSTGSEFNSDWLRTKFSREGALNETDSKAQSILDKLIALAEMIADYSDEDYSFDWDDDDSYWDILNDKISNALYREAQKKANRKAHEYTGLLSAVRPANMKYDEAENNMNNEFHPVKRFTSV